MKRTELKKNASMKTVFNLINQMKLTPFEIGLMMSLITKMMKHSKYSNSQKDYYLPFDINNLVTSDADSRPKLKQAFKDFQNYHYVKITGEPGHQKLFFNSIKIVK